MDEGAIRLEARLQAIEYLLCNLYAGPLVGNQERIQAQKEQQQELLARLDRVTVPGVDPVQSDVAAAELRDAVKAMLDMILEMAEAR